MRILTLSFFILISATAFSQTPAKTEKIKKFMEASGYSKVLNQTLSSMFDLYERSYPAVASEFWTEFKKDIKLDDLEKLMVPIYDKYFNETDLDALIVFYSSPAGIKVRDVQPLIVKDATAAGADWGRTVGEKVIQRLKEKGYTLEQ
ncbi:MAG: DUF2059 domain-containing protein [Chitinophagaceae bacterium]|nr:DUF2059 domain-containing protein [Chitinophagaceae bacterium]